MNLEIVKHKSRIIEYVVKYDDIVISLLNIGATIHYVCLLRNNRYSNVVLSYNDIENYLTNKMLLGSTINCFKKEDDVLHSKIFNHEIIDSSPDSLSIKFTTKLTTEDDGLPGELNVAVTYTIKNRQVRIQYDASTSEPRYCNLTNNTYWNLNSSANDDIKRMQITANTQSYYEIDKGTFPVKKNIARGSFDFTNGIKFADIFKNDDSKNASTKGIDHFFVLQDKKVHLSSALSKCRVKISSSHNTVKISTQNENTIEKIGNWPTGSKHLGVAIGFQEITGKKTDQILLPNIKYSHWNQLDFDIKQPWTIIGAIRRKQGKK